MPRLKVLLTVTTYPLPSRSYDELVCTAGVLEDGSWIRIYPMPLSFLRGLKIDGKLQSTKYTWIELNLKKRHDDFRPESYSPEDYDFKDLLISTKLDTKNAWEKRKFYCLKNVQYDMGALIQASKAPDNVSLATFKPAEITNFLIKETEREWKPEWKAKFLQYQINFDNPSEEEKKVLSKKVPYNFYYEFTEANGKKRTLMIEDWEIGQLYWNCLKQYNQDEKIACSKVKEKYFDQFKNEKDVYFFLGTHKGWHTRRSKNPFMIIGVFYPPKIKENPQLELKFEDF